MAEEVAESYKSSLDELEFNSKPQISMLTMLAEDHELYASEIVRVIEEQIKKVSVSRKLPILYLLDSIIKNLSTTKYPQLFAQSIVQIFCGVFEEVDEKTRQAMYKLRQTWVDIIPNKQLYLLDRKVQLIDPAWPITAKAPEHGVIHVNPKFLKQNQKEEERSPQFSPAHSETSHDDVKDELYAKEKELQALRLKLELAESKAKLKKQLEEQEILNLKSSKRVIDREPPSVIKLPPEKTSPQRGSQLPSRDPRITRGSVMNRDPRLIKQMERQEQERQEKEKLKNSESEAKMSKSMTDANLQAGERSTIDLPDSVPSQRMDLASLLTSFAEAAQKVAAENKKKSVSSQPPPRTENSLPKKMLDTKSKSAESVKVPSKKSEIENASKDSKSDSKHDKKNEKESPSKIKEKFHDSKRMKEVKQNHDELTVGKEKESKENVESNEIARQDKKEKDNRGVRRESNRRDSKDKERSESKEKDRRERKEKDRRDSQEKDRRDSKEKDRRDSKEKDRRDSKDRGRRDNKDKRDNKDVRDRKDSSERRSDSDVNRHSPRRGYGRHSPSDHGHSYRDNRSNRQRGREKPRLPEPVIHSSDGKTDQFGRMLRTSRSGSSSRDRSPIEREKDSKADGFKDLKEPLKSDDSESERTAANLSDQGISTSKQETVEQGKVVADSVTTSEPASALFQADVSGINEDKGNTELNKLEDSTSAEQTSMELEESSEQVMEMDEESGEDLKSKDLIQSDATEDIDMRIPRPSEVVKDSVVEEESEESLNDSIDSVKRLKRPISEPDEIKAEARPYKIPKLAASRKQESKNEESQEDISNLFGEEDVDYRHQVPKSLLVPPPMPVQNLLSPSASALKSPAQRRWSQFKESHPDDFAQDIERKRLRDAQMQSLVTDVQDVDLRLLTSPRQRSLPLPPLDPSIPIPKDLSAENQEQILQRAEKELKEGRISHGDHQEIVRQLGQVYDIQKKRSNLEERSVKSLDLRDPRLRGIRETRGSYVEDVDRRNSYREEIDMHKKPLLPTLPLSGDMPDESASNSPRYRDRRDNYHLGYESSGKEDYDGRRPARGVSRHDRRLGPEFSRRRDYDLRSPGNYDMENSLSPRDFDDHMHSRYRDFDGRPRRDIDDYDDRSQDFDARRPLDEEEHHRDYRASDRRTSFDEFNEGPHNLRREVMRPLPIRDARHEDIRERRRNTPPQEGPFRVLADDAAPGPRPYGLIDDAQGPRPYGMPDIAQGARSFGPPRHLPPDVRGPRPTFSGPVLRPHGPRPLGPDGPRPVGHMQGPVGLLNANSRISDPMDDPRWSVMRGLLDHEGTEELVIDGKPFELRMGTSRKLRVYGKVMDVAVDLKERGIRIDNQLVYKLGEPIKEVPAAGRSVRLYYHGLPKPIWLDGQQHEMRMDAPPRNVMVDGVRRGFQIDGRDMMILVDRLEKGHYGGPPRKIRIAGIEHDIAFQAPPRRILIDNKSCELKLDSKIPYIIINGKPHGIRFDGEPRTVFINEQPFTIPVDRAEKIRIGSRPTYIAFGGPAHEIIIDGKWFEVKFDNVPKDIHLGNRHFSIRIPGPLPRVKILEELPPNFDESRLMSSNQLMVPQPGQPTRLPMPPHSEPNPPVSITQHDQFPLAPIRGQGQDNMHVQGLPSADGMPGSSGPEPILPVTPLATDGIRTNNSQASEGIMRPVGPITADVRFSQPQIQNIPQPNQPIIAQPGPTMLQQSNPVLHGQLPNSLLNLQRPNLMGFGVNQPGLPRHQPVNLIAQGLLNQVASSMISNQFSNMQGLPDFAAGLRVLSQMTSHVQPHMQTQMTPQIHQTLPLQKPLEDDHGAVMVTGMQGSAFGAHQMKFGKPPATNVQISNAPAQPTATGLSSLLGIVSSAAATSTINSLSTNTDTSSTDVSSATKPPIDINSLLNNLLKAGLIKDSSKGESTSASEEEKKSPVTVVAEETQSVQPIKKKSSIPDLTDFAPEKLKRAYISVIEQLHEGIQCHTCAARFTMNDHEKYRAHLDWHFRQNKMEQEMVKVAKNRKWFYSIPDWIQYEELEDTEEKSRSEIFEQMRPNDEKPIVAGQTISLRALEGKDVIKNPVATGIEGEDVCATCGDPFDQMWNEETEEWILKNTIKVDGKTYHPVCYEDAQEITTPVIAPISNPLETHIVETEEVKLEPADNPDAVTVVEVKTEPMETDELPDTGMVKKEIKVESLEEITDADSKLSVPESNVEINLDLSPQANKMDIISSQAPTLLSTITTTVVREVIPVNHEDPMSPWEMDSNPTPELSRTPTPETVQSFTPAPSLSSESLASSAQVAEVMISEDPIPPPVDAISSAIDEPVVDKPIKHTEMPVPPPVKVIKIEPDTGL